MAKALILEFDSMGADHYWQVNKELGINVTTGEGDWPAGLLYHAATLKPEGGLLVFEVWNSQDDQAAFMNGRLGAAIGAVGVTAPPSKVEWLDLVGHHTLAG